MEKDAINHSKENPQLLRDQPRLVSTPTANKRFLLPRAGRLFFKKAALAFLSLAFLTTQAAAQTITAVGVENQYANVIAQIGGRYVAVSAIATDPNTDPHSFEASPKIAAELAAADLVVENGLGYDDWADRMLAAAPNPARKLINVQQLRRLPDSTPNPHLWYDPATMPAVAAALATDLAALQPAHTAYFAANLALFNASLRPWLAALAAFKKEFPATPVAVTEPVGDDMLTAAGAIPFLFLGAIVLLDPVGSRTAIQVLISYGAVILSFVGAVHWGFALRDTAHPVNGTALTPAVLGAERDLLLFGIVPAVIGWIALSVMLHFNAPALAVFLLLVGLFVLLIGFFITIVVETIGRGRGVVAGNYLALRWTVSVVVLIVLLVVLFAVLSGMRVG